MFLVDWWKRFRFKCHIEDVNDMMDCVYVHSQKAVEHIEKASEILIKADKLAKKIKRNGY
jgi:hypothetical protein